ncbi:proline--tRNA ligase, partial [Mycoplasmopsis cynos]
VITPFCCSDEAEEIIQEETGATARCIPIKQNIKPEHSSLCIIPDCQSKTKRFVIFAKAY